MKIIQKESKIFIRHWFKWYVMDEDEQAFIAVDDMVRLKLPPKINDEKQG